MRFYYPCERSGESYEARVGPPDAVSAAVGHAALQFAGLNTEPSATLCRLTEVESGWDRLLAAALPVADKLAGLEARVRAIGLRGAFNTGSIDPRELFAELQEQCLRAARLCAEVLDPRQAEHRWRCIGVLQWATGRRWRRPPPSWTSPTSSAWSSRTSESSPTAAGQRPPEACTQPRPARPIRAGTGQPQELVLEGEFGGGYAGYAVLQ
jgi:hypothetical protein